MRRERGEPEAKEENEGEPERRGGDEVATR